VKSTVATDPRVRRARRVLARVAAASVAVALAATAASAQMGGTNPEFQENRPNTLQVEGGVEFEIRALRSPVQVARGVGLEVEVGVGHAALPEERARIGHAVEEALGSRKDRSNESRKGEVVRLVISQSGDMAEEFGNFTLSFDQPDKKHISFDGSYLRVWRKINGEWLEDAFFGRPNESGRKE